MAEIKLVKKYPNIRDEDVTEIFQEGYIKGFENGRKNAIPIEWLKKFANERALNDGMDCYWHFWGTDLLQMIEQWEKENEIDWRKEFEDMVRYIGVIDYGKERWFMETEKSGRVRWYDRYDGEYLTTDELQDRIYEVVRKLDE